MKIKVKEAGKVHILELSGELKLGPEGSSALEEAVNGLLARGHTRLVINLKHVAWIDTSGISALVASKKRAMDKAGDVKVSEPSEVVGRILRSCLIQMYIQMHDDDMKAVGSF